MFKLASFRFSRASQVSRCLLVILCAFFFLISGLSGCGNSDYEYTGGVASGQNGPPPQPPPQPPVGQTGRLTVDIDPPPPILARGATSGKGVTPAKSVPLAQATISRLRVHVQSSDGTDVVPVQIVEAPSGDTFVSVFFDEVPISAAQVVVDELDAGGQIILTQTVPVNIEADAENEVEVVLLRQVVTLTASPPHATLAPNETLTLQAAGGSGTDYVWSLSTNGSGGSVSASGVYKAGSTANSHDVATVTDSAGNTAVVFIDVGPVVIISPATSNVGPRGELDFQADGGSDKGFVWRLVANGSGGSLSPEGHYAAGRTGNTHDVVEVTDSLGNSATASVDVGPVIVITPATATVRPGSALALSAGGGTGTGYKWALSTNASGASVSATGQYRAGPKAGTTDVVTVTDSLGDSTTSTISVGPVVTLSPSTGKVAPRGTLALTASGGSGTGFTYSLSTNGSGGTVSPAGLYRAGSKGNTTDIVTVTDSLGNSAKATISDGAGVTATPPTANVVPMETLQLNATGGSGTGFVWTFETNNSGATVSASGEYKAGSTDHVSDFLTVTDSLGNTASVIVNVGPNVSITPVAPTVIQSGTVAFSAVGGSGTYTWLLATNNSGGTINASTGAYVAGLTAGTTDVVEALDTFGNISTVSVTVRPLPAVTSLSPSSGAQAGGNTVVLNGTDFDQVTTVLFGGAPIAFTRVSDTRLEIVAPAGTGVASVGVNSLPGLSYGYDLAIAATGTHTLNTSADLFDGAPIAGLSKGIWSVGAFNLPAGATITVSGNRPLVINSTSTVQINGSIIARGSDGGNAARFVLGPGGTAGPGGFIGGNGGYAPPTAAQSGGGPGGGPGGIQVTSLNGFSQGGGGAGHSVAAVAVPQGAPPGPAYGAANDIPNVLVGGSGGGGGSRLPGASAGGGGGGGGGVIRIIAASTLTLGATAVLDVRGGAGGNGFTPDSGNSAGGGGGGSGGSVWLSASLAPVRDAAAQILLSGGAGGLKSVSTGSQATPTSDGGVGALGTLVIQP